MLWRLDDLLIIYAQRLVSAIELYTPCTRKALGSGLSLFYIAFTVVYSLFVPYFLSTENYVFAAATVHGILCTLVAAYMIKESSKKVFYPGEFPKEIHVFAKKRFIGIVATISMSIILLTGISISYFGGEVLAQIFLPMNIFSLSVVMTLVLALICDYYLCTTPLPPGEKEKHKVKQELKHAVPSVG